MTATTLSYAPGSTGSDSTGSDSNLGDYLRVIWKRRWEVLIVFLAVLAVCLAYCGLVTPTYQASADLLVSQPLPQTLLEASNSYTPQIAIDIPTNIQVVESSAVKDIVERTIPDPPSVTATEIGLTDVLKVSCESSNAAFAARAANAYANAYLSYERGQTAAELTAASNSLQDRLSQIQDTAATINDQVQASSGNAGVESELVQLQGVLQTDQQAVQSQIALFQYYAGSQTGESGSVLTSATAPNAPARPKVVEYSIFAGIIGIVLGLVWALGWEHVFRS